VKDRTETWLIMTSIVGLVNVVLVISQET
jgi:hypothetical protein